MPTEESHPLKNHPLFWMWRDGIFENEPLSNLEEEQTISKRPAVVEDDIQIHTPGLYTKESTGIGSPIPSEITRLSKTPTTTGRKSHEKKNPDSSERDQQ